MTETAYETITVSREGMVAVISINNPPMNVINMTMGRELLEVANEIATDDSVRAVVIQSANEGVFVAGADLSMMSELTEETLGEFKKIRHVMDVIAELPQPTVAALGGMTLGGGFELALACDFRFMAEGFGEIGCPEVRLGLLPAGGGTQRLPRIVGSAVATEMLLKGMRYGPDKAFELGIVHRVIPGDQLNVEALKYAQSLAAQAPMAVQAIKKLIRVSYEAPHTGLDMEKELFEGLLSSSDAQEGISAFFEGRKPAFTGS
jgi:enoyl-CoA hydratase